MMNKNYIIISIMILILSFTCFASGSWSSYANAGFFDAGHNGFAWSSVYPQGNYNFTAVSDSVTSEYLPLVYYPLSVSSSLENYIYTFSTNSITAYSGFDMSIVSSITTPTICGQPVFVNLGSDSDVEIAVPVGNASVKFINIYNLSSTNIFTLEKSISILNTSTCAIDSDFPYSNTYIASLLPTGVHVININTGVADYSFLHSLTFNSYMTDSSYPYYSKPIEMIDIDNDGVLDIFVGNKSGTTVQIKRFDYSGSLINTGTYTASSNNMNTVIKIYPVNIGSPLGAKEIVYVLGQKESVAGLKYKWLTVWNPTLTNLYAYELGKNYGAVTTDTPLSDLIVSDYDKDGSNEFCYRNDNTFDCYSSSYSIELHLNNTYFNQSNYEYIAIGEYDNSTSTMEIVTPYSLYQIIDYNTASEIYNFSILDNLTVPYVVTLKSRVNYTKDILFTRNILMNAYYSFGSPTVCGDSVCSAGETISTCPADCLNVNGTLSVGDFCSNSEQCFTGKCLYGKCDYKQSKESCVIDSQCLSQNCDNSGKCSEASLVQGLTATKNSLVGNDQSSSDLFCFLIIIVVAVLIGFVMFYFGITSGMLAIIVMAIVFNIGVFFLSSIGWLSGFYAFIVLFLDVLIMVMMILFGSNMSGR